MVLEIGMRPDLGGTKSAFSFLDLLNGPTSLSPQNLGWSGEGENSQENFSYLLCPPTTNDTGSSGISTGSGSPHADEDGSHRNRHSFSDTTNSSSTSNNSMSMPDLQVWGIGEGNGKEDSSIPLLQQLSSEARMEIPSTKCRSSLSSSSSSSTPKRADRGSDKYKIRRERNNISVRKSRAKTKSKVRRMEDQISRLDGENRNLKAKLGKVRKFLGEFESSFFSWRNILREVEEELSSAIMS